MTKIEEWAARANDIAAVDLGTNVSAKSLASLFRAMLADAKADGWKMAPFETTPLMDMRGWSYTDKPYSTWVAMLAAAPDVTKAP